MNFQEIAISKQSNIPPPHFREARKSSSLSSSTSGIEDLIDNVLNDIEEHEEKYQEKLFKPRINHRNDKDESTKATASMRRIHRSPSASTPQRLPLSTTEPAVETKIAFITHKKRQPPQVSLHTLHEVRMHHSYPYIAHTEPQYKIFSPNPFYPGQSLPILVQVYPQSAPYILNTRSSYSTESYASHDHQSITHSIIEDPISKMERVLRDKDDTEDGYLDFEEFEEAIQDIDNQVDLNVLGQIFRYISGPNSNEISITRFMKYIGNNAQKNIENNYHQSSTTITPKTVFRGAFPDIFGDINDEENRELWGDAQMSSVHKLAMELQQEADNEGVIDFPEFEAAVNNMGIALNKDSLKQVFAHFLGEQDIYDEEMGVKARRYTHCDKKYELKLGFLMDLLKENVENHQHLQPKQILKLAFMELLLNDKTLNKRSSFLSLKSKHIIVSHEEKEKDDDSDDSFKENLDFDADMESCIVNDENKNEVNHSKMRLNMDSLGKGDRSLMRMGSSQHWTDDDVIKQKQEMEQHFQIMMQQQNQNEYY